MSTDECFKHGWVMVTTGVLGLLDSGFYKIDFDDQDWQVAYWNRRCGVWEFIGDAPLTGLPWDGSHPSRIDPRPIWFPRT